MDNNEPEETIAYEVRNALAKRADGKPILLDWNAFDSATIITEPQLKDIHTRLLSAYPYEQVARELREEVKKKRAEILAVAKTKIHTRVLQEWQNMKLKIQQEIKCHC